MIKKQDLEGFTLILNAHLMSKAFIEENILTIEHGYKSVVIFDKNNEYKYDNKIESPIFECKEGITVFSDPKLFEHITDVYDGKGTLFILDNADYLNQDDLRDFIQFNKFLEDREGTAIVASYLKKPENMSDYDAKVIFSEDNSNFIIARKGELFIRVNTFFEMPF